MLSVDIRNLSYILIRYGADDETVCAVQSAVLGLNFFGVDVQTVGVLWVVCCAVDGLGGFNPGMCVMIEFFTSLPLTLERCSMTIFAFSIAQNYELDAQGIPWLEICEF